MAEDTSIDLPSSSVATVQAGVALTLNDIEGLYDAALNRYVADRTGTDAKVSVDRESLVTILTVDGHYILPIAASASKQWNSVGTFPLAPTGLNDANIEYITMMGSAPPKTLRVCKNWTATTCDTSGPTGWLNNGQKSSIKFGWPDTDGYHHPSNSCTTYASFGVITYTFTKAGWIKTSGLSGGTWRVNMYCT